VYEVSISWPSMDILSIDKSFVVTKEESVGKEMFGVE